MHFECEYVYIHTYVTKCVCVGKRIHRISEQLNNEIHLIIQLYIYAFRVLLIHYIALHGMTLQHITIPHHKIAYTYIHNHL